MHTSRSFLWTGLAGTALLLTCGGCATAAGRADSAPPPPAADFYVAANGNDAWSGKFPAPVAGKTDGPFATLERARNAVRALRATKPAANRPIQVIVRGGFYPLKQSFLLEAQDSGTADAPLVYRACPGESVRLSGGPALPSSTFRPVTDAAVLARLDPSVRDRVVCADLHALGIADLGTFPKRFRGAPQVPELFFNDKRMPLARWPNIGWATIAKIVDPGSIPRTGDKSQRGGVFEYSGDRPARWSVDSGVWLRGYWCFDWFSEAIRVKSIAPDAHRITMAAPTVYGVKQGNPSPRRWYALNVLEELDSPGEYYIDRENAMLYFLPPAPLTGAHIVVSTLTTPLVTIRNAAHIVFRGFIIEAGLGDGVSIENGEDCRILACEVRNTRALGIRVSGGTHHRVEASDVHDTGTGGIALAGGDRRRLIPAGHEAINNHIWRFSCHQLTYANAITLSGVGNRAAHNLIHDAPHQAISVSGNDHVFEYNEVHHVCTETDDCGAYYKGRNPSCRGNIVRYNFWHDIGSPMGHGNAAVYFDDGDGGDFVIGNVFFRCGDPGKGSFGTVFSHGGHDLLAENNLFIECKRALGSAPWNYRRWKGAIDAKLWQTRLLKEVDITKPPYTTRYPALVGFMDPKPDQPRVSQARRNVFVMCGDIKSGNWQVDPKKNWATSKDPGFVNAAKGDFALCPNSEAFRRLPGFKPIPFDKIGLYADALRPVLPPRHWNAPPPKPLPPLTKPRSRSRPRKGPAPVFKVSPATAPITVDGTIEPKEWPLADPAKTMKLAQNANGAPAPSARQSRAWLAYDRNGLYVGVDNAAAPETRFEGNTWGRDDAVEISLRVVRKGKPGAITVVRGFGNGILRFGTTPNAAEEPTPVKTDDVLFKARVLKPGRWTAEFYIPFHHFGCDPRRNRRVAFSLTVRKSRDNLWLMWTGTRGHSYDVARAGFVKFVE